MRSALCQHRKLAGAQYAAASFVTSPRPVRGFPDGLTARPMVAAILDNITGEVEALKVQIGFLPGRLETEAPFCLEGYNNLIARVVAASRWFAE
jgi:hypothetical protein